jgi:hypothetical protein
MLLLPWPQLLVLVLLVLLPLWLRVCPPLCIRMHAFPSVRAPVFAGPCYPVTVVWPSLTLIWPLLMLVRACLGSFACIKSKFSIDNQETHLCNMYYQPR